MPLRAISGYQLSLFHGLAPLDPFSNNPISVISPLHAGVDVPAVVGLVRADAYNNEMAMLARLARLLRADFDTDRVADG